MRKAHHTYKAIGFLLVIMGLSSCLQETEPLLDNEVKLTASLLQTKAAVDPAINSDYAKELKIGLSRIDENSTLTSWPLFTQSTKGIPAIMSPGDAGDLNRRKIDFTEFQQYNNATDKLKFASWYPYEQKDEQSGKTVETYNKNTKTVKAKIDGVTDIMYGSVSTGNQSQGMSTIYFDHALVKYTFKVYAMVQQGWTQEQLNNLWGQLKSIKIKGLPLNCEITLPIKEEDKYEIKHTPFFAPDETPPADQVKDFYVPHAPGDNGVLLQEFPIGAANAQALPSILAGPPHDHILNVEIETSKSGGASHQLATKTLTIARNFKPGKSYEIYLRFSDHGLINAEVAIGEWGDGEDFEHDRIQNEIYYDLSAAEHANSYIVTSANYSYCFDISTKGNGTAGIVDGEDVRINPGFIDVLWMDESLFQRKTVDGKEVVTPYFKLENNYPILNRVLFHVTNDATGTTAMKDVKDKNLSAEGNVLLGVYDKKPEEGGKLLWTWHIWLTDRPRDQAYKNGFVALDRDMGAVASSIENASDPASLKKIDGLYYQWGRPTPMPLGRKVVKFDGTTKFPIYNNDEAADLATRIVNPDQFYRTALTHPKFSGLWGYRPEELEYHKTIYDPCPPGYRMSSNNLFKHLAFMDIKLNPTHKHAFESTVDQHYKMTNALAGFYKEKTTVTGYFDNTKIFDNTPGGLARDKFGSYLWSGTCNVDDENVKNGTENPQPISLDCPLVMNNGVLTPKPDVESVHTPSNALPVRCVSIRSMPEVTDLSSYQTANSYIISRSGLYKFKATVRGNGIAKLVAPGSENAIDLSEGLKTDISDVLYQVTPLWWQTCLSAVQGNTDPNDPANEPIPVKFINDGKVSSDGYVYFYVRANTKDFFRKGNLIVAGRDRKGTILWTWHLWLTENEPEIHRSHDFAVMDRFLGATVIPKEKNNNPEPNKILASYGFYYQWGRKDPFPGPSALTSAEMANETTTSPWWKCSIDETTGKQTWTQLHTLESTTDVLEEKTVANSVKNPTRFHRASGQVFNSKGNNPEGIIPVDRVIEITNEDNAMSNQCFNKLLNTNAMWGYSSATGFGRTTTKTMYDPCPPGYSVAYYLIWTSASINESQNIYTAKDWDEYNSTNNVNRYIYGMETTYHTFDHTWYPYAGYLTGRDAHFKEVGTIGRFHSSTPGGNGSRSLYYRKEGEGIGTNVYTGQALGNDWRGIPSSYAYPVRCQKD